MEFSRPEYWSRWPFPSPGDHPNLGVKPRSPVLQADSLPTESPGKPKNTGVGSLCLFQRTFPTQESNRGLLHCRWILYQLSSQGSPFEVCGWVSCRVFLFWFCLVFPLGSIEVIVSAGASQRAACPRCPLWAGSEKEASAWFLHRNILSPVVTISEESSHIAWIFFAFSLPVSLHIRTSS